MGYFLLPIVFLGGAVVALVYKELALQFEKLALENEKNKEEINKLRNSLKKDEFKDNYKDCIFEIIDQKKKEDSSKSVSYSPYVPEKYTIVGKKDVVWKETTPGSHLNLSPQQKLDVGPLRNEGRITLNGDLKLGVDVDGEFKFNKVGDVVKAKERNQLSQYPKITLSAKGVESSRSIPSDNQSSKSEVEINGLLKCEKITGDGNLILGDKACLMLGDTVIESKSEEPVGIRVNNVNSEGGLTL